MKTKRRVINLFCIVVFIFVIFSFSKTLAVSETQEFDIVFSEVMWMGSSVSSSDEWIELYNNTTQNKDLSGWQITYLKQNSETKLWEEESMLTIPSGIIPSKGYFLIVNNSKDYKFTNGESILNIDPDYINSNVSLSNSKLQLKLYDSQWNDGRLSVDIAGDGGNPVNFAGSNSTIKASMFRTNTTSVGSIKTNWAISTTQKNLDSGVPDLATPENSGKPGIEYFQTDKIQIDKAKAEQIIFSAKILSSNNLSDIESVNLDLSQIRADLFGQEMCDEVSCGDQSPKDGVYTFTFVVGINDNCGNYTIPIIVTSGNGLTAESSITINIIQTSEDVKINEVLPKPEEGTDKEYIELYNQGNEDVDLYQWQLDDKADSGSKPYTINDRAIIKAKGYQVFYKTQTNLSLNDSGDFVRLILPNGIEEQSVEYSKVSKNESYNNTDKGWFWSTTLTPNQANIITAPIPVAKSSSKKTKAENNKDPPQIAIANLKNYQPESYVIVTGIVSAPPNIMATTYFYIQDETGGIQVYCYDKDFPNLAIGDKIQITGRVSGTAERRIKIESANDIIVLEQNYLLQPKIFYEPPNYLDYEGMLVQVKGIVTETSGDTFYVQDDWGEIVKIYIKKSTGIDKPKMSKGDYVKIIGIVDLITSGFQISPVLQNHVEILESVKDKNKSSEDIKNSLLISTAHAASKGQVLGLSRENKYLQNPDYQNISNSWENIIKIIVIACSLLLIYLIGEFLWKKHEANKM